MFDMSSWVTRFWHPTNQFMNKGSAMSVIGAAVIPAWHCIYTWQMTNEEMRQFGVDGQSLCYVVMLDEDGYPLRASDLALYYIRYAWEGIKLDEIPNPSPFEKALPEPPGNIALFHGAKYWLEIGDKSNLVMSDRVLNITATNPQDSDPNSHHVSVVVFQRAGLNAPEPDDRKVLVDRADLEIIRKMVTGYLGG